MLDLGERGNNDVSFIQAMRKVSRAGLSTAGKLLSEDLPLCDRFRERRPRAFSEEELSSRVQRDVCASGSKLTESCSKLPREEDEKKRKRVIPIVICFTSVRVYHGRANSQLRPIDTPYIYLLDPGGRGHFLSCPFASRSSHAQTRTD
jgi:hypothetical protein